MVDVFITGDTIDIGNRRESMSFTSGAYRLKNLIIAVLCSNGKVSLDTLNDVKIEMPDRLYGAVTSIMDVCKAGHAIFGCETINTVIPRILQDNLGDLERIPAAFAPIINQAAQFNEVLAELKQGKTTTLTTADGTFTIVPHDWGYKSKLTGRPRGHLDIKFEGVLKIELSSIKMTYKTGFFDMLYVPSTGLAGVVGNFGLFGGYPILQRARCVIDSTTVVNNTTPAELRRSTARITAISLKHRVSFSVASALAVEPR
jgi:hypothetical protein